MPLTLPAGVQQAIGRAVRRPVLWGRITLTVLDRVLRLYNDWTTLSGGTGYVSSYQTTVVKEHTLTANPPARVQMSYPGQAGDPIPLVDAFRLDGGAGGAEGQPLWMPGEGGGYAYQSVMLAHGSEPGYPIHELILPLWLASTASTSGSIILYVYELPDGQLPRLLAISNAVTVASLNTSTYADTTFTFATPPTAVRGRRIHMMTRIDNHAANVRWRSSIRGLQRPQETAGYLSFSTPEALPPIVVSLPPGLRSPLIRGLAPVMGLEFDLRVRIRPYRYDGVAPPTHRERINLGRVPSLPGYLDCRYRTPGDSRIRFRLWKSATGAWAGEEVELGTTDTHTLYRDGHDGSVAHVHDGDAIGAADLVQYYQLEANFLGTNGFSAWAATTAKSVRAVVKPSTVNGFLYECTVAGNTGSTEPTWPTVPGTTVTDGTVTWRALRASFLYTAEWHAANVRFPDEVFDICSSQTPILGALACIGEQVPSIALRLDVGAYITEPAKLSLPIVDQAGYATQALIRAHLKNLPIELRLGYELEGRAITTPEQLAPYFTGLIDDFTYRRDVPTLMLRDATSSDLDVNIPSPRVTSDTPAVPLDFTDMHLVDALEQIVYSECGRPRRYQERESWADVKAALGPLWVTDRLVAEPTNGRSLAKAILEAIGAFLVPDELGRTRLVQYPRSGSPTFAWGDQDLLQDPEQGESFGALVNAAIVGYGGENQYVIDVDPEAQHAFAPGSDRHVAHKKFKGEWLGSDRYNGRILAQTWAAREVRYKAEGLRPWTCRLSHAQLGVQVGDIGTLSTDVALRRYERGARSVPATVVVISKRVAMDRDEIEFTVLDAKASKTPPQPITPGVYFTMNKTAFTAPDAVTVNATGLWFDPDGGTIDEYAWDQDYDGHTFQVDATGINPTLNYGAGTAGKKRIALRVKSTKDGLSATTIVERQVRALVNPTAVIDKITEPNPNMPMNVLLTGAASVARSGEIVKWEWDDRYDGSTFVVRGTGPQLHITMPYQTTTVALRVTDGDGLTGLATLTLTGKELAPPSVTGFYVQQVGGDLVFRWDPNPDIDLYGYTIWRAPGASPPFTSAVPELEEIQSTGAKLPAPRPGTQTYFIKAIDTTGNYSAAATSITVIILDPKDRNVVVEIDEAEDGWPGTKTSLVYDVGGNRWWIAGTSEPLSGLSGTLGGIPASGEPLAGLGTLAAEGTYEGLAVDLGAVISPVRITVIANSESFDSLKTTVIPEIRVASNDSASPSWGNWEPARIGDYAIRHFQARVRIQQTDQTPVAITGIIVSLDVPDIIQDGDGLEDVAIAAGGSTITFPEPFNIPNAFNSLKPKVVPLAVQNASAPRFVDIPKADITRTSFKAYLRDSTWADVGGGAERVDFFVSGF